LPLIEKNAPLTDTINLTIAQIFLFLEKILGLVPDLLISQPNMNFFKKELGDSFKKVVDGWNAFDENNEQFFENWREFIFWWQEFNKTVEKLKESGDAIYLSMN
jgi:hypothetical protein